MECALGGEQAQRGVLEGQMRVRLVPVQGGTWLGQGSGQFEELVVGMGLAVAPKVVVG